MGGVGHIDNKRSGSHSFRLTREPQADHATYFVWGMIYRRIVEHADRPLWACTTRDILRTCPQRVHDRSCSLVTPRITLMNCFLNLGLWPHQLLKTPYKGMVNSLIMPMMAGRLAIILFRYKLKMWRGVTGLRSAIQDGAIHKGLAARTAIPKALITATARVLSHNELIRRRYVALHQASVA